MLPIWYNVTYPLAFLGNPARLTDQAKDYMAKQNISVSEIGETHYLNVDRDEESTHAPLVQKLTGILPADVDVEQEYGR